LVRWVGRGIGLDVHRDFSVIAVCEDGKVRSVGHQRRQLGVGQEGAEHLGGDRDPGGEPVGV
jgi:hypothetical protein